MAGILPSMWSSLRAWRRTPAGRAVVRHAAAWAAIGAVILLVHRQVSSFVAGTLEVEDVDGPTAAVELPPWMRDLEGADELRRRIAELRGSLFDDGLIARAHDDLAAHPWVREVIVVRRDGARGVEVEVQLRRPAAAVNLGTHLVLVDGEGVRLPGVYGSLPDGVPHPIFDLRASPPPAGEIWSAPEIAAALEMLALHERSPLLRDLGVTYIRIDGADSPRATLILSNGARIAWGSIPSRARPGEPTFDEKLDRLRQVEAVYPGLRGVREVPLDPPVSGFGRNPR